MAVHIPVSGGVLFAVVDDDDAPVVLGRAWYAIGPKLAPKAVAHSWYGSLKGDDGPRRGCVLMHRLIMCPPPGMVVDHVNGDPLDNRRGNLRVCTSQQNNRNAAGRRVKAVSAFKGVQLLRGRYRARIRVGMADISLGYFSDAEAAARAYDRAAVEHFGDFARLNFPGDVPDWGGNPNPAIRVQCGESSLHASDIGATIT